METIKKRYNEKIQVIYNLNTHRYYRLTLYVSLVVSTIFKVKNFQEGNTGTWQQFLLVCQVYATHGAHSKKLQPFHSPAPSEGLLISHIFLINRANFFKKTCISLTFLKNLKYVLPSQIWQVHDRRQNFAFLVPPCGYHSDTLHPQLAVVENEYISCPSHRLNPQVAHVWKC